MKQQRIRNHCASFVKPYTLLRLQDEFVNANGTTIRIWRRPTEEEIDEAVRNKTMSVGWVFTRTPVTGYGRRFGPVRS